MKKSSKISLAALVAGFMFALPGPISAAGTTVNLGTAGDFAILAGSGITNTGPTTITGDVGTFPTTTETGFGSVTLNGTNHAGDSVTQGAKDDLVTAYNNAAGQGPTTPIVADLGGQTLTPGVYNSASSIGLTGTLTLDGGGNPDAVFIFQAGSTLTTAGSSRVVLINSAQSCHVFWQVGSSATLGTNSTFVGTILALTSATLTTGASVDGRVLAQNGAVTLDTNTVSESTCAIAPSTGTLHVVKNVTNDDGGSASAADFTLHVKLSGTDVSGSPAAGTGSPGTSYSLAADTYAVSEDSFPSYTQSFSGDCSSTGSVTLAVGEDKTCTITNNDTGPTPSNPATLHVIKRVINDDGGTETASDFNLHVKLSGTDVSGSPVAGTGSPGTFYLLAAGTYAVSENADDSYVKSFSGDCSSTGSVTLAEGEEKTCTITNNDISDEEDNDNDNDNDNDVDIKVTKKANPSALHSGPGSVTYTYEVTNEGDVSLKDVSVKDDKCSPVVYVSGRKNENGKLDTNEKWKYTCTKIVSATETNKVTAKGTANGERVHDHAKATVTVSSVPGLPSAGIGPEKRGSSASWNSIIPIGMLVAALFSISDPKEIGNLIRNKH